jgi:hypothetical protein
MSWYVALVMPHFLQYEPCLRTFRTFLSVSIPSRSSACLQLSMQHLAALHICMRTFMHPLQTQRKLTFKFRNTATSYTYQEEFAWHIAYKV